METKEEFELLNWSEFEEACSLIKQWAVDKNINSVYGIPRGGLTLAVKLSHLISVPLILDEKDITPNTLIVDDIADTGVTLDRLIGKFTKGKPLVVTLYYHNESCFVPNWHYRLKTSKWIVFPWEDVNGNK